MLAKLGHTSRTQKEVRIAVKMLESEIARTDRADLKNVFYWANTNLKELFRRMKNGVIIGEKAQKA